MHGNSVHLFFFTFGALCSLQRHHLGLEYPRLCKGLLAVCSLVHISSTHCGNSI